MAVCLAAGCGLGQSALQGQVTVGQDPAKGGLSGMKNLLLVSAGVVC
jgi:hypothetical protein